MMKCKTCKAEMVTNPKGRKRLYCSDSCKPYKYKAKGAGLSACQVCGASLTNVGTPGRPKRNCSRLCRGRAQLSKHWKPKTKRNCQICNKTFETALDHQKNCSKECNRQSQIARSRNEWKRNLEAKYPDRTRTVDCGWCGEPRTFKIGESVVNAYHPDCSKEAQRARYRIKTVKRRNKLVKPSRLAADEVFRTYGPNCHICELPIDHSLPRTSKEGLTVDHVIPLSKGGLDTMDNLRPAHWSCNRRKADKTMEELNAQSR
jgi:5-methylcytosine-specific restriction endonuclease McrA